MKRAKGTRSFDDHEMRESGKCLFQYGDPEETNSGSFCLLNTPFSD